MVHGTRQNAKKMRNLRCKSADSGVSCNLNRNPLQQDVVQSSRLEFNDLNEEDLDFEPDVTDGTEGQLIINSDVSSVKLYSDGGDGDSLSNVSVENYSRSTLSMGHRRDMLPTPYSDAEDGRQNEYLPVTTTFSSSTRTIIDSSSDDSSSGSDTEDNGRSVSEGSRDQNINDIDDLDQDGNEGMFEITQEEEERLLDSDGEYVTDEDEESHTETEVTEPYHSDDAADEEEERHIETGLVETCVFGNARITLPKFSKPSTRVEPFKARGNDLKRTTSMARSHKIKTKKKKKWDLHFTPEVPPPWLFLGDLGFIAEYSSDEERDGDTSSSVESVPHIRVTCNVNEKVVCDTSSDKMSREIHQVPKNDNDLFKLPLPPPKRPPTRPKKTVPQSEEKRTVFNSENSNKNLHVKVSNNDAYAQRPESSFVVQKNNFSRLPQRFHDENKVNNFDIADKDDIISIIASTIEGDNNEEAPEMPHIKDRESPTFDFEGVINDNPEAPRNLDLVNDMVQNWVQSVPDPDPLPLVHQEEVMQPQFRNNIVVGPSVAAKGNIRVYFKDVPSVFAGLCYHFFFNGSCVRKCNLIHYIPRAKYTYKFKKVNPTLLCEAYDFSLKYEKFFKEMYACFVDAFGFFKMQKKLVACIEDVFKMNGMNRLDALEIITKNLEDTGLTFLETVELISFNIGFLQYPELGDILLDLVTRTDNISQNWDVIKKLGRARGQISPDIVKRILSRVTSRYPINKKLCLDIFNVIIRNEMTDLSQIGEEHLAPLRTLAGFRDTTDILPKQTVKVSPTASVIGPMTIPHNQELLAAHIDSNLIKERERYEREVEGRTVKVPLRPTYVNSYGYDSRNVVTSYDNFHHNLDSDDRFVVPKVTHEPLLTRDSSLMSDRFSNSFMGGGMFSAPSSSMSNESVERGTGSPRNEMLFEPPSPLEISQYVPENVRQKDVRNDITGPRNPSPLFQPLRDLPPLHRQGSDITLTPSRPIFGQIRYRNDFMLDKSLHNLLPDTTEHVNINERDIVVLDNAIKSKNGAEFYRLLRNYKSPATLQNFITMTIAHLKTTNELYDIFMGLVQSLETVKPDFAQDRLIKAVLEVVVMNLLFELERKGLWSRARELLEKFCDWDSLISSQLFQIFSMRKVTTMGRYIFLAKVFAKSRNFHYTYEILQCPSLHLLEAYDHWPYFYNLQADLRQRNDLLTHFFKEGYRYSITDVSDMYRRIYKYGNIHGYDAHQLFNPMLITIMNDHRQVPNLKHFYPDIDVYYKVMDKNVLRAFTILLFNQLNADELYRLYELCCERQIYTCFQGGETNITVRNNMMDEELNLILNYYFYKISRTRRLPVNNVIITIKLLESQVHSPKILQSCCRSISEVNETVRYILRNNFNIFVSDPSNSKYTDIEIMFEQIAGWLRAKDMHYQQNYW